MSNIGTKIERLIADGFSYNTLRGLSESQVNLLYSRLIEAKPFQTTGVEYTPDEVKQMATKGLAMPGGKEVKPTQQGGLIVTNEEDDTINVVDDPDATEDGMGMFESEIGEKFESKAQQKLFWAKCNNSKSDKEKKKWCKWAKEYSDDTNFKKLPEKKKHNKLEESLTKLVEKYIPQSITKRELMKLIESSTRTKEAPPKTTTKPKRKNPFEVKPHEKGKPKALATMGEDKKNVEGTDVFYNKLSPNSNLPFKTKAKEMKEGGAGAPAKAPVKTPTKTPSKPQRKNPFKIEPAQKPGPKAMKKGPEWLSYSSFIKAGYQLK